MIVGIELLCDNCLKLGPQVSRRWIVSKDEIDSAPMITVICPTCYEKVEHVFVGTGTFDEREV